MCWIFYFEKWAVFNQHANIPLSYWKVEEVIQKGSYWDLQFSQKWSYLQKYCA
jgi:hypothetical protein